MLTTSGRGWVAALCLALAASVTACQDAAVPVPAPAPAGVATTVRAKPTVTSTPTPTEPNYPSCRRDQVALSYGAGGAGTGDNFATIAVTNPSDQACELRDVTLTVIPLDRLGRAITVYRGWPNTGRARLLVLGPHSGFAPGNDQPLPADDPFGALLIGGNGRDDDSPRSTTGECVPRHEVTPYAWQVSGTFSAIVRNLDLDVATHPAHDTSPSVYACADPYLQLISVDLAQLP